MAIADKHSGDLTSEKAEKKSKNLLKRMFKRSKKSQKNSSELLDDGAEGENAADGSDKKSHVRISNYDFLFWLKLFS